MSFDILSYLQDRDINYWAEGKNVAPGWIGISCLFCSDHSNHLGINLKTQAYSCWLCHEKGSAQQLISFIEDCDPRQAFGIMAQYEEDGFGDLAQPAQEVTRASDARGSILPPTVTEIFASPHHQYLTSRGFDADYLIKKYRLHSCHTVGKYRFRIVIPILLRGRIVSFIARDITDKAEKKYLYCPTPQSLVPRRQTLYNIDSARRTAVIVEGPFDVWRIGDGAIASMGTMVTTGQIKLLIDRGIKDVFVMFDRDAIPEAHILAKRLTGIVERVEVVELLDEEDPGVMSDETLQQVRELLQ